MDDTGPILGGDKVGAVNTESGSSAFRKGRSCSYAVPKVLALKLFEDLRLFPQDRRHPLANQM